ncbi:MAG: anthranilate/aminodeoxychorismate synthase component II [Nitrospiraceae bacterium]|nr:anthranilate/aminodeoxychorismate synthase component II [Nitrospiraceae bacterium]
MILMIDNYDSFTYNLVQELSELTEMEIRVIRNDAAPVEDLLSLDPDAIVISPGPGIPEDAGVTVELIRRARDIPLLGICLGHQALAAANGARIIRAPEPVHGKTSPIEHDGSPLYTGIPNPFTATRYHSLVVDRSSLGPDLAVTAWTADGLVMGLANRRRPHFGVQFHPESYLSREGKLLLGNFLRVAGLPVDAGERRSDHA